MFTSRFVLTVIGFALFIGALFCEGTLFHVKSVPRETNISPRAVIVKQGVTQDGIFSVTQTFAAPNIPPRLKIANHPRTLRAFSGSNRGGLSTLYIEAVVPHEYFTITGSYSVSQKYPTLQWSDTDTLMFFGERNDGQIVFVHLNVETLQSIIDVITNEAATSSQYEQSR